MLFSTKKFILMDCFTGRIVFSHDDLEQVVDMGNKYSLSGGKDYQVFTNLMKVSHTKIATPETFEQNKA